MDSQLYQTFSVAEEKHWWFSARRIYIEALLRRLIPQTGSLKLAEIGAGTGGNFKMLSRFGQIDAIEMDDNAIKLAQEKARNVEQVQAVKSGWLPDNIPLEGTYDCVFALDVIEHVEDDKAAIETLLTLLKPSGYLLTTVPAYQWLWSAHDEINHHHRRYTKTSLRKLFPNSMVRIVNIGYFNTLLFPLAVLRRMSQRLAKDSINPHADLELPGKLTNKILEFIFSIESKWAGVISVPFGLSVISMVQKNE